VGWVSIFVGIKPREHYGAGPGLFATTTRETVEKSDFNYLIPTRLAYDFV